MVTSTHLGAYLRARRELVRPEDVGLPGGGRRRVPGLRREELALLAGISADYYLRLEQGRDQHPSAQVVDALAGALMLDDDATAHLHRLARPAPRRRAGRPCAERALPGIRQLVMSWTDTPAFVQGRYTDVLAANPMATALGPYAQGVNLLRATFLDPRVRELHRDWEYAAPAVVASLRAVATSDSDDPRLTELVTELSARSEEFRRLWARHDVRPRTSGISRMNHPRVGPLELNFEKLSINGTDGQLLVVYHAEPGSPAAQSLALLSTIAAGRSA
ncbi:helix-turn-helix transcriptional regulator [Streptomyces sp. AK02-01A]|uniref:helix-turn-helix transcriptional regulator n=1 Tax=Streptomyces sp. AK02-01A TaxID=3028648 RepID=UPI0029B66AF6|nr:helix-turn-helix transcriptional regulator [Streptomyces sp. AK02-01A]MDX3852688.1 helix-turn-helix transcriptional regulator [Streptomyces sp. AK02-01A]